jgi:uncharacterized protein (TIGR03067 family)
MPKLALCTALFAAALVSSASADDKAGPLKLDGGYTIVSGEEDGKAVPADHIKGSVVLFTADRITGTDRTKKEFFAARYTLDASKNPAVIRMTGTEPKSAPTVGLVKKDGDTVTLIYALPGAPAPTEFKTQKGQHLFVLRPLAKGEKQ